MGTGPEARDEGAAAAETGRMIGREEHLLEQRLQLARRELRELRQNVPQLVDLAALPADPGEDLLHGPGEPGVAISDHEERRPDAPRRQVVEEGHPGVRALPRPEAEVQQHNLPVLAERVGGEDPLLRGARAADGVELAIQKQVAHLHVAQSRVRHASNSAWSTWVARLAALFETLPPKTSA